MCGIFSQFDNVNYATCPNIALVKDKSGRYWCVWKRKDKGSDDHHNTKALASNVADKTVMYWKLFAHFVTQKTFAKSQ